MLNAQAGAQQATLQANQAALQAGLQSAQYSAEQRTAAENAAAMRDQVEVESRVAQENLRRSRDEFTRKLAAARADMAGSGVNVATGSPLEMMIEASKQQSQLEAEQRWQDETARRAGFRKAAGVALGGRVAGLNSTLATLQGDAALAEGRTRATQARLEGLAGRAQAAGMRGTALGGLFGSITNSASQYQQFRRNQIPA